MHIPDGFLSTPVWAGFDAIAVPAAVYVARKARDGFDDRKAPLLGVMGAFVFAAQMIQFPVGLGTSGHLVGSALLSIVLGPAAASVVMMAILAIQALVFQDGGVLALGANMFNMAIAAVLAGYLPYHRWGARKTAIFGGAFLSVLVAAILAVAELLLSGIRIPAALLYISFGLFAVSALLEGAITVAVVGALEKIEPGFARRRSRQTGLALGTVAVVALMLAGVGVLFASTMPDGLQHLAQNLGLTPSQTLLHTPLADYETSFVSSPWMRKASAGVAGLALIFGACLAFGRLVARPRPEA
jgi:cobalt/nickel transport system permease protein